MEIRVFVHCEDHEIPMIVSLPEGKGPFPCMLLLHGFMAYKEGDGWLFTKTAGRLSEAGIASARIDFCSMGENRYSREYYGTAICIKETKAAFAYLQKHPDILADRIGLLGHSMGGRIAFLSADLPSKCMVTFNGALKVDEPYGFMLDVIDEDLMEKQGYNILHTSDGRVELLFKQFADDLAIYSDKIYQYTHPILVCIGAQDPTVDPQISKDFVQKCHRDDVQLLVIEGANHTFNAKTGDYTKVHELLDRVIPWLQHNL